MTKYIVILAVGLVIGGYVGYKINDMITIF